VALTAGQQAQVSKAFQVDVTGEVYAFVKADLAAAVAAADAWAESNAASYNSSLPAAFRTTATATQKAALLGLICWLRAGRPLPEGL
jgi:hypothetical protein